MTGRPTDYSEEIADLICHELMLGASLNAICQRPGMKDMSTVLRWLQIHEPFAAKYARAREIQAEVRADEIGEIADNPQMGETRTYKGDGTVEVKEGDMLEHRKLRIATRQWYAEKLRPKVYGNKLGVEHSGSINHNVLMLTDDDLVQELVAMLASGRLKLPGGVEIFEQEDEPEDDFSDVC